ncbi:Presenilin-1 [Actinomortierella ambigua]|uniref:Presenilin n=1 Tax=Actinomortierella ambigua TaxID=1343610 RepID=A0A9P6QDH5_9FUNG|nr:Presenilin-1 [Actinomortierella ambigua]
MADTTSGRATTSPEQRGGGEGGAPTPPPPPGGTGASSESRQPSSTTAAPAGGGGGGGAQSPPSNRASATSTGTSVNNSSSQGGPDDQPCQSCGNFPARFQCAACQSVRYCSKECQAEDWHIHYRECAEIADAAATNRPRSRVDGSESPEGGRGEALAQAEVGGLARSPSRQAEAARGRLSRATVRSSASTATLTEDPLGPEGDRIRETANRPRRRPQEPPTRRPRLTPEQIAAYEEAERIADMKFYMLQVYKIIKPVVVCICLSILWVKISMAGSDYRPTQASYAVYRETPNSTPTQNFVGSLANAGIIIGQIVVVTIIIVFLFKKGYIKVLIGFFMVVVALLLGFMGYVLVLNLIQVLRIPLDYITMSFALWNFAVVGLLSVFWKGPMWLQQTYLTLMSSLMAFSLTGLAEWTTWMLLALLVIWDLIAVLCPFGPLKILVESSRNQNQEVPALLYTVNAVWFMASPPDSRVARTPQSGAGPSERQQQADGTLKEAEGTTTAYQSHSRATGRESGSSIGSNRSSALGAPSFNLDDHSRTSSTMNLVGNNAREEDAFSMEMLDRRQARPNSARQAGDQRVTGDQQQQQRSPPQQDQYQRERERDHYPERDEEGEEDDDDDGGLKLGLGDFVFYSVLVARAAMFDWVTTLCCMVAVLTGMNATIFLLAIYRKALPALPISICFGMLFYFATRFAVVPFLGTLAPNQVFI